jgi:hypothetical protein
MNEGLEKETDTCWGPLGVKSAAQVIRAATMARIKKMGRIVAMKEDC